MAEGEPPDVARGAPRDVPEAAAGVTSSAAFGADVHPPEVAELYRQHALHLIRLAVMLVDDRQTAEDIVQDAFAAILRRWRRLADPGRAVGYLRASVVNGARAALRRRRTASRHRPDPPEDVASAEHHALGRLRDDALRAAIGRLPRRQREVILLRYLADLSVAESAAALHISQGAVKSSAGRAMKALASTLGATS